MSEPTEFAEIARLLVPLTRGASEALGLLDDAAVIGSRPDHDLVISKDAMVSGVHFAADTPPDIVARKLMRANLSDLAAKGAEPFGYFLMTAWSDLEDAAWRAAFAAGLAADGRVFDISLFGGDTVTTPGPLTLSMTALGWVPKGQAVLRSGARVGDLVAVSGPIGDGWLDWAPDAGRISGRWLKERHRLANPRLDLRQLLRGRATACADISDGLVADAGHVAKASGVGMALDLGKLPVSPEAEAWLATLGDREGGLVALATGGDDYELVITLAPDGPIEPQLTVVGVVVEGAGVVVSLNDKPLSLSMTGWAHG